MFCRRRRKVLGLLMEELKSNKKNFLRILLLLVLAVLITVFFVYDLKQYLTLEFLQESREVIRQHYEAQPFQLLLTFFCIYLVTTTLSLPGAAHRCNPGDACRTFFVEGLGSATIRSVFENHQRGDAQ